jgi:hypothetical protein
MSVPSGTVCFVFPRISMWNSQKKFPSEYCYLTCIKIRVVYSFSLSFKFARFNFAHLLTHLYTEYFYQQILQYLSKLNQKAIIDVVLYNTILLNTVIGTALNLCNCSTNYRVGACYNWHLIKALVAKNCSRSQNKKKPSSSVSQFLISIGIIHVLCNSAFKFKVSRVLIII